VIEALTPSVGIFGGIDADLARRVEALFYGHGLRE
jgi:hypothetical protein